MPGSFVQKKNGAARPQAPSTCPHALLTPQQLGRNAMHTVRAVNGLQKTELEDGTIELGIADDVPKMNDSNVFTSEHGEPHTVNTFDVVDAKEVNILSDRRLKANIMRLTEIVGKEAAVDMLHAMHVHRYHLKTSPTQAWHLGVMADEYIETISPVLGAAKRGAYDTVNYNHILMLLLLNTQLLERRVRVLEAQVSDGGMKRPSHGGTDIITPDVVADNG